MKNLANCTPTEFLIQTNKIRKAVSKWLTDTEIMEIRKRLPAFEEGISTEEAAERRAAQAKQNLSDILDAALELHPRETLEVLAQMCFIAPEDMDNHRPTEYMAAVAEMIANEEVISFFSSLMKLVQMLT